MAGGGGDMPAFVPATEEEIDAASSLSLLGERKGPFLIELIADARNGNEEDLREAILYLKAGLGGKKVSLADVVQGEDLIPILIQGLSSKKVPIVESASWIVCEIIAKGTPVQREKVMVEEGATIYPIFLKMLASPNEKIWQHSLNTLVWMFDKERTRPQLQDSTIIPAITKLAEKADGTHYLRNVAKVACFFSGCLSLDIVEKLVALYKILYQKTKDDETTTLLTQSLNRLMSVEGAGKVIISGGILPWVVGYLSHYWSVIRSAVIIAIEKLVGTEGLMVDFFKALKGTEGMKVFYKSVWNSKIEIPFLGATVDLKKIVVKFFLTVSEALGDDDAALKTELSNAILESGFVESLVKCLEEENTPTPFTSMSITILSKVMKEIDMDRLGVVIEAGAVPLLVKLLSSSHKLVRCGAIVCLGQGNLIKTGPKVRDEVIQLGGLDKLIGMLEGDEREGVGVTQGILTCFEDLLAAKPVARLDKYEKLPACLKELSDEVVLSWFLINSNNESVGKVMIRVFRCVGHLAAYGKEGLELVEKCGILERIIGLLPYNNVEAQRAALETLIEICKADEKYVPVLIRKGIMEHFELLGDHRGMEFVSGFGIFFEFLAKGLTPGQQHWLNHISRTEHSALTEMFTALVGSEDPIAVFKEQINKVLSRQAGVNLSVS